ncbi:hypothetical protein LOK49_Contig267G00003 [Camellia lanceoleosa]|nr:hypothetical protein LOK49_Contig267G00003 [Camellia lanceoleosa]
MDLKILPPIPLLRFSCHSLLLSHTTTSSHSSSLTDDFVGPIPPLYHLNRKSIPPIHELRLFHFDQQSLPHTLSPPCNHYRSTPSLAPSLCIQRNPHIRTTHRSRQPIPPAWCEHFEVDE